VEHAPVAVETFRGRLVPQRGPKGFKRLRSDGGQATKPVAQGQVALQAALAKGEGVVKGAGQISARVTSRQRYEPSTGRDPVVCPHCRSAMGGWRLWHPPYGVLDDEGEVIKRGTDASSAPRAGP